MILCTQVERHDAPLLALDTHQCVTDVHCDEQSVRVTLCGPEVAAKLASELAHTGMIAGGREWGCVGDDGFPSAILRKISGAPSVVFNKTAATHAVLFRTQKAKYQDFFKTSNISFQTSIYEKVRHITPSKKYTDDVETTRPRRLRRFSWSGFKSWVRSSWRGIRYFGSKVQGYVQTAKRAVHFAGQVVEVAVTGNYNANTYKKIAGMSWNYQGTGAKKSRSPSGPA